MGSTNRGLVVLLALLALAGAVVGATTVEESSTPISNNADGTVMSASDGPSVTLTGDTGVYNTSGGVSSTELQWKTTAGSASFSSNGSTEATVHKDDLEGTWTNVTAINTTAANLTIDPADKSPATVGGEISTFAFKDAGAIATDDGVVDFVYSGTSGESTISVRGLPADTTVVAVDSGTGEVLGNAHTTGSGEGTFRLSNSEHNVELVTSDDAPSLSDPEPEGPQPNFPTELSIDVSDSDFPDDNVSVEFYLDGTKVGESSTSSNGRVSTTISEPSRGTHEVRAVATDSFDQSTELTWTFGVPNEMYARNVSDPDGIIDDQEVTFTFYKGDDVTERTTTTGNVSLEGLDVSGDIIVTVDAPGTSSAPAYQTRTFLIEDLTEQQSVYLLPESETEVYNVFTLDDMSGDYNPSDSMLIIQRSLNISGESQWATVSGGEFDVVNEHKTNLELDARYRLIVKNQQGEKRVVGNYVAQDEANPKIITIKNIIVSPSEGQDYYATSWIEDVNEDEEDSPKNLRFSYNDPSAETDELRLKIYERGNESTVLDDVRVTNVGESWGYTYTLEGNQTEKSWMIEWSGTRNGEEIGQKYPVGEKGDLPLPMSAKWLARFGLVAVPVVAALSSERIATLGSMGTVAFAGILMISGIWEISILLWFAALIIAVGGHTLTQAQRGSVYG